MRVAADAAYGERALHAALDRTCLEERERALVTELVYGTLRHQLSLDAALGAHLSQPLRKLPPPVLAALRLGAYQLIHTRVPPHSAVHESVDLVRRRFGRLGGVVNAVLRKVAGAQCDAAPPEAVPADPVAELALTGSHPTWLVEELLGRWDADEVRAFMDANNARAPLSLRVNRRRSSRAEVVALLRESGRQVQLCEALEDGLLVPKPGKVKALPGFAEGLYTVQDMAATLVGLWAAPVPGSIVLDACAAPGGKSTHLAELMGDEGVVVATDVHPAKMRLIAGNAERLGLEAVRPRVADAQDGAALAAVLAAEGLSQVDLAVLDAPCSGLGTLRRNPELRHRTRASLQSLVALQARLLGAVAPLVRPGGALLYAVCTLTEAEGPAQVQRFLAAHPAFRVAPPRAALAPWTEGPFLRTYTHRHGTDSFFAARLEKIA